MMGDELDNGSRISGHCRALAPFPSERGAEGGGVEERLQDARLAKVLAMAINVQTQPVESTKTSAAHTCATRISRSIQLRFHHLKC